MGVLKAVVFEHAKAKNMMKYKIQFTKLVAAGNDFVLIDNRNYRINSLGLAGLAMRMCQRKYGAGADGLLVVERSPKADFKMRIFNSDGSEAEMCGNGSRCFALYCAYLLGKSVTTLKIETLAGTILAKVNKKKCLCWFAPTTQPAA